ncbi:hypothetical protein Clacol_001558 [Clathrus columnatus]|uniref:DUF2423 domain-containing protein n=1 Tax=Clathrus columnatus TaxID=1419009 RepID=A0AAV5A184_9AGAM|nr:hypothetical protein Clacol_001558 [Clathrus columnatus]
MAKSLRSKTKRSFRRVKRESGTYAVADATRLERLSSKLHQKIVTDKDGDVSIDEIVGEIEKSAETGEVPTAQTESEGTNVLDSKTQKISTSGPRLSRRDSWRISKGLSPHRRNPNKTNRLGVVVAKRRAGRAKRRR